MKFINLIEKGNSVWGIYQAIDGSYLASNDEELVYADSLEELYEGIETQNGNLTGYQIINADLIF